jgi:hypothetical protein
LGKTLGISFFYIFGGFFRVIRRSECLFVWDSWLNRLDIGIRLDHWLRIDYWVRLWFRIDYWFRIHYRLGLNDRIWLHYGFWFWCWWWWGSVSQAVLLKVKLFK